MSIMGGPGLSAHRERESMDYSDYGLVTCNKTTNQVHLYKLLSNQVLLRDVFSGHYQIFFKLQVC